ncbi:Single-stranded DNA-binding protein [Oryzisolibacter propanilivorax]|uniref:Single-stranded DNA-binding protein n=1 Tax=Oryzisolibacter propanilivorax TaxID=1527607 RepID=A0A1G9TZ19_9BURK|nr:Single-stranded DNA-binding protein [Oryzisolibacter propanilivorax]
MMDALIAGRLHARPEARTSKTGKPFATAKLRAAAGDGANLFVNVIAFEQAAVSALLALDAGDSIAIAGAMTPKVWTDREGTSHPALDVVAHAVLTSYHVTRKRRAMQPEDDGSGDIGAQGYAAGNSPTRVTDAVTRPARDPGAQPNDAAWRAMAPAQQAPLDDGEPLPF